MHLLRAADSSFFPEKGGRQDHDRHFSLPLLLTQVKVTKKMTWDHNKLLISSLFKQLKQQHLKLPLIWEVTKGDATGEFRLRKMAQIAGEGRRRRWFQVMQGVDSLFSLSSHSLAMNIKTHLDIHIVRLSQLKPSALGYTVIYGFPRLLCWKCLWYCFPLIVSFSFSTFIVSLCSSVLLSGKLERCIHTVDSDILSATFRNMQL